MDPKDKLRPCPFCDGKARFTQDDSGRWWFRCCFCHITGGPFNSKDDAEKTWDSRTGR